MNWQVQSLDFPEYQLRAPWTSAINNMHRHTHFLLRCCDCVVVIAACVSDVWFKWYRFIAFIYSATQLVFRSTFFEISNQVGWMWQSRIWVYMPKKCWLESLFFSLIRWEYFACVCVLPCRYCVFVCFTRMLFCRGSILVLPAFSFLFFLMLLSLSEKVAVCSVQ